MKQINISDEGYEFLKDLCNELRTQPNDGNADPIYWGVLEDHQVLALEGDGDPYFTTDDGLITLEDAIEYVDQCIMEYNADIQDEWKDVWKDNPDDVSYFIRETLKWDYYDVIWQRTEERVSTTTGAFLTKRACKKYIETNAYHHDNPRTYAMTAFRNYELEKLLKVLKSLEIE